MQPALMNAALVSKPGYSLLTKAYHIKCKLQNMFACRVRSAPATLDSQGAVV